MAMLPVFQAVTVRTSGRIFSTESLLVPQTYSVLPPLPSAALRWVSAASVTLLAKEAAVSGVSGPIDKDAW